MFKKWLFFFINNHFWSSQKVFELNILIHIFTKGELLCNEASKRWSQEFKPHTLSAHIISLFTLYLQFWTSVYMCFCWEDGVRRRRIVISSYGNLMKITDQVQILSTEKCIYEHTYQMLYIFKGFTNLWSLYIDAYSIWDN